MIIYYNPGCSKCNEAVTLLRESNCSFQIREYLKTPPSITELKELLGKLGCSVFDLVRKSEPLFLSKYSSKDYSDDEWLKILSENPVLIERPIIISGEEAIIGRPPSIVIDFAKKVK